MKIPFFNFFLPVIVAMSMTLFMVSCEGPVGPAGADGINGIDGVDAEASCIVCHGGNTLNSISTQFHQSVHAAGLVAVDYAGGRAACAQCHSHEGFVEFATFGAVAQNIAVPSPFECRTCHQIHESFDPEQDYTLRISEPRPFIFDENVTADFSSANICASCHQTRRAEPNVSNPGTTFRITSGHYGPHYGAQSNIAYGAGLAEIPGSVSYPAAGSSAHYEDLTCTSCHMGTYEGGAGGHTFNPSINSCTACHAGAEDFNIGNTMTDNQNRLNTLQDLLEAQGVIAESLEEVFELDPETGDIVLVIVSDGFAPVPGEYTMAQAQAFFNWSGVKNDRSLGVHNPAYTEAILVNSIEAIQ
jgi:hypothetical protein